MVQGSKVQGCSILDFGFRIVDLKNTNLNRTRPRARNQ